MDSNFAPTLAYLNPALNNPAWRNKKKTTNKQTKQRLSGYTAFLISFIPSFFGGGGEGGKGEEANEVYYGRCTNDEYARMLSFYLSIDSKSY